MDEGYLRNLEDSPETGGLLADEFRPGIAECVTAAQGEPFHIEDLAIPARQHSNRLRRRSQNGTTLHALVKGKKHPKMLCAMFREERRVSWREVFPG